MNAIYMKLVFALTHPFRSSKKGDLESRRLLIALSPYLSSAFYLPMVRRPLLPSPRPHGYSECAQTYHCYHPSKCLPVKKNRAACRNKKSSNLTSCLRDTIAMTIYDHVALAVSLRSTKTSSSFSVLRHPYFPSVRSGGLLLMCLFVGPLFCFMPIVST